MSFLIPVLAKTRLYYIKPTVTLNFNSFMNFLITLTLQTLEMFSMEK